MIEESNGMTTERRQRCRSPFRIMSLVTQSLQIDLDHCAETLFFCVPSYPRLRRMSSIGSNISEWR